MSERDIAEVCRRAPEITIVAVHMEVINHCLLSCDVLKIFLEGQNLSQQVVIPADGERVEFS